MMGGRGNLAATKDLLSGFRKNPKPGDMGGEEPAQGWVWPGDGPHGELGREGDIRLWGQKWPRCEATGAAPELPGWSRDEQGGSNLWMSPLLGSSVLMVTLGMDETLQEGQSKGQGCGERDHTPKQPTQGSGSTRDTFHGTPCWMSSAERGWWHLPHGPSLPVTMCAT